MKRIMLFSLIAFQCAVVLPINVSAEKNLIKIGVLAKRGVERCLEQWSPTADYLTEKIPGHKFIIVPLDHGEIYTAVENQDVQFILTNPSYYVALEKIYGVKRIATLKNLVVGKAMTVYGGVVFCRNDRSDIRSLDDLRDKTFMAVEKHSLGGFRAALREFKAKKIVPQEYFSDLQFGGTHDAVVYAVRDGRIDAGTVRTDTLERMQAEGKIKLSDFYIIRIHHETVEDFPFVYSTRMYPEWPMAEVRGTSDELAQIVDIALLDMSPDSPAAVAADSAGWTIALNYQPVHECLRELRLSPYENIGKITLKDVFRKYGYWILLAVVLFMMMAVFSFVIYKLNQDLESTHKAINTSNLQLKEEIEERKRTEKKLIQAKVSAEAAARAKNRFLANMSHEIRTPMNGVIASADLALSEDLPEKARHYLQIIQTSAYSLMGLFNDILDFSKIESEKLVLEKHPFRLDEIFDRVADLFINKAAEKRIEFLFDIDWETPRALVGDSLRLQQVLINLVSNAVKFTGRGGVIQVGVRKGETDANTTELTFFVKDSGIGISQEYLPNLFKPFSQADSSTTRKYGGAGLGLSICQRLVDMMGGSISLESELGKGSTFSFTVLLQVQPEKEPPPLVTPSEMNGLNVLVVDDSIDSLCIMQKMLKSFGFHVESSHSAAEALKIIQERLNQKTPIDLVIMDCFIEDMDGIKASESIRNSLQLSIPIILLIPYGRKSTLSATGEQGISGYLTKPIYPSTLFDAIMDAFGRKSAGMLKKENHITTKASIYKERLKGRRVLVVEDNQTNREIAVAVLESAGMSVQTVENGFEAVTAVLDKEFDAVLMDLQMPEMDGFEATRRIRENPRSKFLPIIAMTAHAMKGDEEKCLQSGMDGYISKPINQNLLYHTLWRLIRTDGSDTGTEMTVKGKTPRNKEQWLDAPEGLPATLPGINVQETITALQIDESVYKRILIGFLKSNGSTPDKIKAVYHAGDRERLQRIMHDLKSGAGNIGAADLYAAAKDFEKACATGTDSESLSALLTAVESATDTVLTSIETLITSDQSGGSDIPETPDAVTPVDISAVAPIMDRLAEAMDIADPEEIGKQLNALQTHLKDPMLQELEKQINEYEYEEANKTLKEIAQTLREED